MGIKKIPSSFLLQCIICLAGAGGMLGQLLLIRELFIIAGGNEIAIGIVLSNWLLLEAMGALGSGYTGKRLSRILPLFIFVYLVYIVVLPIALFFSRDIIVLLFQTLPGEGVGYSQLFISSLLILSFPAVFHGAHFPLSAGLVKHYGKTHNPEGSAYFYETLGTLLAGILFTFFLALWSNIFQVFLVLAIVLVIVSAVFSLFYRVHFSIPAVCLAGAVLLTVYFPQLSGYLHQESLSRQWHGKVPVHYSHSPHGNIMVFQEEQEHHFYYDGRPFLFLPHPQTDIIHDYVHFSLGAHPDPKKVLIIGGAHGPVLREILHHPLNRVIYTEIDPLLIRIMDRYFPDTLKKELDDPRLEKIYKDGRLYLVQTDEKFDFIALGFITPDTLQTNRFFSHEFFELVKSRLGKDGLFVFSLPGSDYYLPPALRELNTSIYNTLQDVFPRIRIIPGEINIFFASDEEIPLSPDILFQRLEERKIESGFIHPSYLEYRLSPDRTQWFYSMVKDENTLLNRDFLPHGFHYASKHWQQQFSPSAGRLQEKIHNVSFPSLMAIIIAGGIIWLFLAYNTAAKRKLHITLVIGSTGILGMSFDLIVLFLFQCIYGYVYHMMGLLMGLFMFGAFMGSRWSIHQSQFKKSYRVLCQTEGALIISIVIIYLAARLFSTFFGILPGSLAVPAFMMLAFYLGFLIGAQFPLAASINRESGANTSETAGVLYAADLLGGWAGGLFFSLVLFPYYGLARTLLILGTLKLFSFLSLLIPVYRGKVHE